MSKLYPFRRNRAYQETKLISLEALLTKLRATSDSIRRPAFFDYVRQAQSMNKYDSATEFVDDFRRAREAMGTSLRPNETQDQLVFDNMTTCQELMRGQGFDSSDKADERDDQILDCVRRIVAIVLTLPVNLPTREMAIRFMLKADMPTKTGYLTNIPPAFGYYAARAIADRWPEAQTGLSVEELREWRDHVLANSRILGHKEFQALTDIGWELEPDAKRPAWPPEK